MDYGLEIYNDNETLLVGANSDLVALIASDIITLPADGSQVISIPGMRNTDQWSVFLFKADPNTAFLFGKYVKGTDQITLSNSNSSEPHTFRYLVMRSG